MGCIVVKNHDKICSFKHTKSLYTDRFTWIERNEVEVIGFLLSTVLIRMRIVSTAEALSWASFEVSGIKVLSALTLND
jgi:hypothetical protein